MGMLAVILLLSACSSPGTTTPKPVVQPAACTFTNPVAYGQDPWVVRRDGWYYLVESRDEGIYLYKSRDLTDIKRNEVRVWTAPDTGWNQTNVWAPELHPIDGRWYIYYAAGRAGPPFIHQRSGVLESVSDEPQGAYVDKGMLLTDDDGEMAIDNLWAIDLTVTRLNGQLYAVWSGWEENRPTDKTPQHLYIAPMSNPWTISDDRVRISSPTESWERGTELDINEGPQFLEHGSQTFLVYSARESWLKEYKLGLLSLRAPDADPLNPESWIKTGPVFTGTSSVYGVGHASFTVSPDSTENWIVYHSKTSTTPGWERVIRTQEFTWNPDGTPDFGTPVPSSEPIPVPSGQCTKG